MQNGLHHLETEYNRLKISLYRQSINIFIAAMIVTSTIETLRALYYSDYAIMVNPIALIVSMFLFSRFLDKLDKGQVVTITAFHMIFYTSGLLTHYFGDTGYFDHSSDAFYFAYAYALFERIVVNTIPTTKYKVFFSIFAILSRVLIIPLHEKGLFFIQCLTLLMNTYFDNNREKSDKQLFQSNSQSKEQLEKFKNLVEFYIPESIVIVSQDLTQSLFVNKAFKSLMEENSNSDIRVQLDRFQLREPVADKKSSSSFINQTLLTLLQSKTGTQLQGESYHLSFKQRIKGHNNPQLHTQEKIFEVKILDIVWDEHQAIAIVLHDITQQQAVLQLKIAADINKDRMLATVSHELRTPLNGILGMIQIMHKKIHDQELLGYLKMCKNSANLLLGLVNSILDLNQIRVNRLKLYYEKVPIEELLREILCLFEFQCTQKKIYLKLKVSPFVPRRIFTDRNRLSQIFINLIGNAVKFTTHGSITIIAEESDEHPEMIIFGVQDTGMGIREEDKANLFQMYGRLDQTDEKINRQGVGLGLTISNNLARILCGEDQIGGIKVESQYGKGSTFSFMIRKVAESGDMTSTYTRLDLMDSHPTIGDSFYDDVGAINENMQKYQTLPFKRHPATESPKRVVEQLSIQRALTAPSLAYNFGASQTVSLSILIVDDNPFNITVATHLVSSQGFNVKSALYGQTAIEIISNNNHKCEPIKMILMDCQMPVMDGYETTRNLIRLMREGKIPEIPIVALTANNSVADREECRKAGMCDYLTKPLTEQSLIKVLKKYSWKNMEKSKSRLLV